MGRQSYDKLTDIQTYRQADRQTDRQLVVRHCNNICFSLPKTVEGLRLQLPLGLTWSSISKIGLSSVLEGKLINKLAHKMPKTRRWPKLSMTGDKLPHQQQQQQPQLMASCQFNRCLLVGRANQLLQRMLALRSSEHCVEFY